MLSEKGIKPRFPWRSPALSDKKGRFAPVPGQFPISKRGNTLSAQLSEKTFKNERLHQFLPPSSYRLFFSRQSSVAIRRYRLKTVSTYFRMIPTVSPAFSFPPRCIIIPFIPSHRHLPADPWPVPIFPARSITFSFSFLPPCQAYRREVCFSSGNPVSSRAPPPRSRPFPLLSSSLRLLSRFAYPTIEGTELFIHSRAIWAHTWPERRTEIKGRRKGACLTLWRYKPQTRQTNTPRGGSADPRPMNPPSTISSRPLLAFFRPGMTAV